MPRYHFHIIIPARLGSTRLPNKMLLDLNGRPMVVQTALQALKARPRSLTVAVDNDLLTKALKPYHSHGIQSILTDEHHVSGTHRLEQAVRLLGLNDDDIVVNVQGDEPLIDPHLIQAVAQLLSEKPDCVMATAAHPIIREPQHVLNTLFNPNTVKVVCDTHFNALYFSRAPIPFYRDAIHSDDLTGLMQPCYKTDITTSDTLTLSLNTAVMRHIGIYAYRVRFLKEYPQLIISPLEQLEKLEQLRVLWNGYKVAVMPWTGTCNAGVDTLADLNRVREWFKEHQITS